MTYNQKRAKFSFNKKRGGNFSKKRKTKKEVINPKMFIKKADPKKQDKYIAENTFSDFEITALLKKNIEKREYIVPSPIQDKSIPIALKGGDVLGIANTGTGKTVAFAIPVINKLLLNRNSKAIIMAPTRELAQQIFEECKLLLRGSSIKWAILIGGVKMGPQLRDLSRYPQIVIGTPGRIKDHIENKKLKIEKFDTVVLDEVDRMLDMGFVNDMKEILSKLPKNRQSLFFSATMDEKVQKIIDEFSANYKTISVKTGNTSENVDQSIQEYITREDRYEKLHDILNENRDKKVLIFKEMKYKADRLGKELSEDGFKADSIHGGKSQGQRQKALLNFKRGKVDILVATDVAARGIDVKDVALVINYETPQSYDDYVHRIGRAGRAGSTGNAVTFVQGYKKNNNGNLNKAVKSNFDKNLDKKRTKKFKKFDKYNDKNSSKKQEKNFSKSRTR